LNKNLIERAYSLVLPTTLVAIIFLNLGLIMLPSALATKGSYSGGNGKILFEARLVGEVDTEIFVMNPDGSDITRLTSNSVGDSDPCWSPDGSKILYSRGDASSSGIWVMNTDGSNQNPLTTPTENNYDREPAWSSDGKKIAFIRQFTGGAAFVYYLYVMAADGTNPTRLLPAEYDVHHPSWSPDGTKLLVGIDPDLALVNPKSDSIITQTSFGGLGFSAYDPCWSPDGLQIIFTRKYHSTGDTEVCVINGGLTGTPTVLVYNGAEPNWSPDGTNIIFSRMPNSIWIINSDGLDENELTPLLPGAEDPDYQTLPRETVGGVVTPVDKFEMLTPYIALAGLLIAVSTFYIIKKRED